MAPRIVAKNIHDLKRPMNQNLGYPSAAQMSARHFRKIGWRAHASPKSGLIILWFKTNYPQSVGDFSKILGRHELSRKIYTI